MKNKWIACVVFIFLGIQALPAQTGVGFRFSSWINHFYRAETYPLMDGYFSHAQVGAFYRLYKKNGGLEIGLSYLAKPSSGIPFVAQDFGKGYNTQYRGGQLDFLFGPQFNVFRPKTGYVMGIRQEPKGFLDAGLANRTLSKFYMFLPIGFSIDFPTSFGTVGGSLFYQIGMTNVIRNPYPDLDPAFDGGKQRAIQVELTVLYGTGAKKKPVKKSK